MKESGQFRQAKNAKRGGALPYLRIKTSEVKVREDCTYRIYQRVFGKGVIIFGFCVETLRERRSGKVKSEN